jgi:hypothetical protein
MKNKHILHLVTKLPDKYNGKFIEFSERNLTQYQHTYVALVSTDSINEERELSAANVINLNALTRWQKMKKLLQLFLSEDYDLVIFHGLSYTGPFLLFLAMLFKFSKLGEKTLWMTWGGDIYYFQNRPDTVSGFFNELLRKSIIKRLFFTASLIPDELSLLSVNYKTRALEFDCFYPNPIAYEDECFEGSDSAISTSDLLDEKFSFMLGNSADPRNNHLDMLQAVAHLSGHIKIYCVLSYAIVDVDYVDRVKALGAELFGDDFIALTDFMNPVEYKALLEGIDFSCYYHNRQQAMGNIFHFLHMGKTVFIRSDTLSYCFLQERGLAIQDSNSLTTMSIEKLTELKDSSLKLKQQNQKIMSDNFSDHAAQVKWQQSLAKIFAFASKKH